MAFGYNLPPPKLLEIHDANAADKLKSSRKHNKIMLHIAMEVNKKSELATLLTVIGEKAQGYPYLGGLSLLGRPRMT